jgi:hypothetical protein
VQRSTTSNDDSHQGAVRQDGGKLGSRGEDLLEIIKHKQQATIAQLDGQLSGPEIIQSFADAKGMHNRCAHERRIEKWDEVDEVDSVRKTFLDVGIRGSGKRQSRFADPARAAQGQKADILSYEQATNGALQVVASYERAWLSREMRGVPAQSRSH